MRALDSQAAISYAALMDALPVVGYLANSDGVITYLSRGWERLTGNDAREVIENGYEAVIYPDDLARVNDTWSAARIRGTSYRDELRVRFDDGSYHWVLSQAEPIHEAGAVVGWCGTITDIRGLRSAEDGMARALDEASASARNAAERAHFVERLLDASDDCVKILDLEGRLLSMSANGQTALGILDFSAVEGTPWVDFWSQSDRGAAEAAITQALAGGRGRFTGLYSVAGGERWWDVTVTPILGPGGLPDNLLAISRDVTEMTLAHRNLASSEERYRVLSDALPGVTWAASPAGELTFVGESWTKIHGKPPEGALGQAWLDSLHPSDFKRVIAVWQHSLATGEPYDIQFRVRIADGSYRWYLVRALPVREADGTIVRWIGVNVDIDDQRRADEGREQFVRLVEASDDFIGIGGEDGNMTYVNEAGRRLLGIGTLDEARATRIMDYFAPEDCDAVDAEILPAVARDGRWTGEFRMQNFRTGERIPIWYDVFSLLDETGTAVGLATVSRDLRGRHRFEVGMRALAETGAAMYGSLDFDSTVSNVAEAVARSFASFCVVDALQYDGTIRSVAAARRDRPAVASLERAPRHNDDPENPVARAIRRGESTLITTVTRDWTEMVVIAVLIEEVERLDVRSLIVVPIRSSQDGRSYGALTCVLDGSDSRGNYTAEDLRFAEEIASRAGLAFDHARAYERERRIAVTLQEASLPRVLPAVDDLLLSADYRPGKSEATIGGDWYDAFVLDDGRVAITVGDVLGKGLSAAVTMGKVRQAMQAVAMVVPDPNAMLAVADRTVRAQVPATYATALAGIFDSERHEFTFASAGHPGPTVRSADGTIQEYSSPGVMLGLRPKGADGSLTVATPPGCAFVFFTDGLVEATRDIDEGHRRLHAALADAAVAAAVNPALALVEHVLDGRAATDDIAVLVAEIGPSGRFDDRLRTAQQRNASTVAPAMPGDANDAPPPRGGTVLTLPARIDEISTARHAVRTLMVAAAASADVLALTEMATGELVANAIDHGTGPVVDVALRLLKDVVILAVTNDGPLFERRRVDLTTMMHEERGRGLAILAAFGCTISIDCPTSNRCTVTAIVPFVATTSGESRAEAP